MEYLPTYVSFVVVYNETRQNRSSIRDSDTPNNKSTMYVVLGCIHICYAIWGCLSKCLYDIQSSSNVSSILICYIRDKYSVGVYMYLLYIEEGVIGNGCNGM